MRLPRWLVRLLGVLVLVAVLVGGLIVLTQVSALALGDYPPWYGETPEKYWGRR